MTDNYYNKFLSDRRAHLVFHSVKIDQVACDRDQMHTH